MGRQTRNHKLMDPRVERSQIRQIKLALVLAALFTTVLVLRPLLVATLDQAGEARGIDPR